MEKSQKCLSQLMRAFDHRTYNKLKFNSVGSNESDCKRWVGCTSSRKWTIPCYVNLGLQINNLQQF